MKQPVVTQVFTNRATEHATRLVFFMAGAVLAVWAPLVPIAKNRVHAGDTSLGLLLLCFGVGAIVAMPSSGALAGRYGCRRVIDVAAASAFVSLLCLGNAPTKPSLAVSIVFFGMAVGSLEVGMNMQAVLVEKESGRSVMSSFHARFSAGGIVGAAAMSGLLALGCPTRIALVCIIVPLTVILLFAHPSLLRHGGVRDPQEKVFSLPGRQLAIIGALVFILFLAEGAMLDWSALFLIDKTGFREGVAGLGFVAFSGAMTLSRVFGGYFISLFGKQRVMLVGSLVAAAGFLVSVLLPVSAVALLSFVMIGVGIANIVPMLFTLGSADGQPVGRTVSFLTILGYSGLLSGPAFIGFTIERFGFTAAFAAVGLLLLIVSACSRVVGTR